VSATNRTQHRRWRPLLHQRYVDILVSLPKLAPHLLDKVVVPQVDLPFEILPDTLSAHSFLDKLSILPDPKPTLAKLSQQNLGRQPRRS
jgi:hypothetical protein